MFYPIQPHNLLDTIRRYFKFSKQEITHFVIVSVVFAFVLTFRDWGVETFNPIFGLYNMVNAFIIVILSIMVHETAHRLYAIRMGYRAEVRPWKLGILISLFLAFLTNGLVPFVAYGGVMVHHIAIQRLGTFRYGLNMYEHSVISLMGPIANMILAVIFKILMPINPLLLHKAMVINILLAVFNMLPFPPLDGADVFFCSRVLYIFWLGFIIGLAAMLLYYPGVLLSVIVALGVGAVFWITFSVKEIKGGRPDY